MLSRQRAYLLDILRSAEAIEEYISRYSRDSFLKDTRTQDAVLRRLMVIGEAAARLTPETTAPETTRRFEDVPFYKIVGMRNRVVHDYGQIDLEIIWETAHMHLPVVRAELRAWFDLAGADEV